QTRLQVPSNDENWLNENSLPSRGVPMEVFQQQQNIPRPNITNVQSPFSSPQSQLPSAQQAGQQQQRRQIRSLLDLRRVLPTEKLIAVWERITTTDEPVLYGLVNINTAPPEVVAALLPENPAAVEEILAYREQNGGFSSVGELLNIATLTQSELQQLVLRVCVKSGAFRIRAAGIIGNQKVVNLIDAIFERQIAWSTGDASSTALNEPTMTVQFVIRSWKER
ncbi:MAG: helix-hairpin-helix domain-containing protein, partial [Armatimonadetes bacterium]|nr:helix-hairpin-helix domain-containing protein [Armatimonadota bacterium]